MLQKKNAKKKLTIVKELDNMAHTFDAGIHEYLNYIRKPGMILWNNFLVGVARGFGIIIGMTVVVAMFAFIVKLLGGIPVVGEFFQWIGEELIGGNENFRITR